jgi:hypothetical protein
LGIAGVGGSSLDKVGSAQHYRMGRAWCVRRDGIREEPVSLHVFRQRQLQPGGRGLVGGADPPRGFWAENSWFGLARLGWEATVKVYGVAVAMPQG